MYCIQSNIIPVICKYTYVYLLADTCKYYLNDHDVNGVNADSKLLETVTGLLRSTLLVDVLLHLLPINESMVKCEDLCCLGLVVIVVVLVPVVRTLVAAVTESVVTDGNGFGAEDCAFSRLNPKEILASSAGGIKGIAGGNGDMYGYGPWCKAAAAVC